METNNHYDGGKVEEVVSAVCLPIFRSGEFHPGRHRPSRSSTVRRGFDLEI